MSILSFGMSEGDLPLLKAVAWAHEATSHNSLRLEDIDSNEKASKETVRFNHVIYSRKEEA